MTSKTEAAAETVRQVVRGERPWTDLRPLGMAVRFEGGRCVFEDTGPLDLRVDVHDLARGFLAHLHDPSGLKEWAFVMEALPVDLDVEGHPEGETVLNALWSASFGEPLGEDQVEVLKELGRGSPSQP
jgi:hypothetical protein